MGEQEVCVGGGVGEEGDLFVLDHAQMFLALLIVARLALGHSDIVVEVVVIEQVGLYPSSPHACERVSQTRAGKRVSVSVRA